MNTRYSIEFRTLAKRLEKLGFQHQEYADVHVFGWSGVVERMVWVEVKFPPSAEPIITICNSYERINADRRLLSGFVALAQFEEACRKR